MKIWLYEVQMSAYQGIPTRGDPTDIESVYEYERRETSLFIPFDLKMKLILE